MAGERECSTGLPSRPQSWVWVLISIYCFVIFCAMYWLPNTTYETVTVSPSLSSFNAFTPAYCVRPSTMKANRVAPAFFTVSLPAASSTLSTMPAKSTAFCASTGAPMMATQAVNRIVRIIRCIMSLLRVSVSRHAAVDREDAAGNPRGFVGGQVENQLRHFFGSARPAEWIGGHDLGKRLPIVDQSRRHRRV